MSDTLRQALNAAETALDVQPFDLAVRTLLARLSMDQPDGRLTLHMTASDLSGPFSLVAEAGRTTALDPDPPAESRLAEAQRIGPADHPLGWLQSTGTARPGLDVPAMAALIALVHRAHHLRAAASLKDPLTGLWNRAYLTAALEAAWAGVRRRRTSLAFLMLDIDRFKELNDHSGHPAGDRLLEQCAAALQSTLRRSDCCGRWGGDEFYLILPDTDAVGAAHAAARLHHRLQDGNAPCTVSIGLASLRADHDAPDPLPGLVEAADRALRNAKRLGGDRTEPAHG